MATMMVVPRITLRPASVEYIGTQFCLLMALAIFASEFLTVNVSPPGMVNVREVLVGSRRVALMKASVIGLGSLMFQCLGGVGGG